MSELTMWNTLTRPRFVLAYQQSRARTWYITALCVAAVLTFDSLWAALFVVLACVEVHPAPRQPTEDQP